MTATLLPCPACGGALPWPAVGAVTQSRCPSCTAKVEGVVFPALFRPSGEAAPAETRVAADQSACFYHPGKTATVPCDGCGRLLCSLCDFPLGDRHLCPNCLEAGPDADDRSRLERRRTLWDSVALGVAFLPMLLFWPMTFVTAPAALFLSIRHWRDPGRGPLPRLPWRNGLAALLATGQIAAWVGLLITMLS